ncbi:hypothetical protein GmHk_U059772 [Glycine max]|nr:hypothetical protein GmHk_U059772 [Glycine max]
MQSVGEAKRWLHSFKGNSLKSWDEVVENFLKTYFPESKTAEGKATISSFHQFPDESLNEALERFRGLLRKNPTHGFSKPIQLNIFIDGLRLQSKQLLDALARGKIKMKTPEEAMDLIESTAATHIPTKKSLLELTSQDALLAQNKLLSKQLKALTETLNKFPTQLHSGQTSHSSILQVVGCTICGGTHESGCCIPNCRNLPFGGRATRDSRVRVPRKEYAWSRHQSLFEENDFKTTSSINSSDNGKITLGGSSTRPQQQMPSLYDRTMKLEETLAQFMQVPMSNQKSTESAIKNLQVQVGQLAKQLAERPSNSFTSNTEKNPKEDYKAMITRSRMVIQVEESRDDHKLADEPTLEPVDDLVELEESVEEAEGVEEEDKVVECKEVPYPLVPSRKDKERHLARFLDIFKKLEITLPFGETLQQIPLYAKFLKDMLTKKNQYIHSDRIMVEGNCNVVIQRILPPKHKDPGVVTIPCSIGEVAVGKALIDLGAIDRFITRPYGVIEDVLVKVKHLIFPTDFIVIDIEEDVDIPLILGRPFMSTARCMVDMGKKMLQMGIEDQKINFDLFHEDKDPPSQNVCLKVHVMEEKRPEKKVLEVGTLLDHG